ncbi:hypothetical protein [Paenibacillus chitinolyticus]|uniref:hypothetical protein n=1 Tax=Paenibacillus chitinolyticus TaxID=79263 RepID=UPI00364691CE
MTNICQVVNASISLTRKAFAIRSDEHQIFRKGEWIKVRQLRISFDEINVNENLEYRLATGEELNWWACVTDNIHKYEIIECSDGLYKWEEISSFDDTEFSDYICRYEKILYHSKDSPV